MDKYKNKYRIQSHRRPHWDYASNGIYFITLVTKDRACNLGQIVNRDGNPLMELSDFGIIVNDEWIKSFKIRQELFCDEYIIMPNHLHAIVVLQKMDDRPPSENVGGSPVETHGGASLPSRHPSPPPSDGIRNHPPGTPNFIRKPRSVSSFV